VADNRIVLMISRYDCRRSRTPPTHLQKTWLTCDEWCLGPQICRAPDRHVGASPGSQGSPTHNRGIRLYPPTGDLSKLGLDDGRRLRWTVTK